MSTPIEFSDAQAAAFEQLYDDSYRPVQPLNARTFLLTSQTGPETLPESGGVSFPIEGILIGLGILAIATGLYTRGRKTA